MMHFGCNPERSRFASAHRHGKSPGEAPSEAPLSNPPAVSVAWTSMSRRLEVELDDTTAAYFERQGCVRRADMAAAASAALRELALRAEVDALAAFLAANPGYVAASDEEYDQALAELPAGGLYSP